MKEFFKKILGITELEKALSNMEQELDKTKRMVVNPGVEIFNFKKEVSGNLQSIEDKVGWRKVIKQLDGWKKPVELVEFYAHVYVLDKGYRKICPPFVSGERDGTSEVDKKDWLKNQWNGDYELRCFMVTKLVIPGYFNMNDFLSNDSSKFTLENMFGKNRKELVSYMEQFNYNNTPNLPKTTPSTYELNFYEI